MRALVTFCSQDSTPELSLAIVDLATGEVVLVETPGARASGRSGVVVVGDHLVVADQGTPSALTVLDRELVTVRTHTFGGRLDLHSLWFDATAATLYVAATGIDGVLAMPFDDGTGTVGPAEVVWSVSGRRGTPDALVEQGAGDSHHVNSVCMLGDRLVASAFGQRTDDDLESGTEAGYIVDLTTGERIVTGLHLPHTLVVDGELLLILESVRRRCTTRAPDGTTEACDLPIEGFARGLTVNAETMVVGSSRLRRYSRRTGNRNAAGFARTRPGVTLVDRATLEVRRHVDLAGFATEVFDVLPLPDDIAPAAQHRRTLADRAEVLDDMVDDLRFEARRAPDTSSVAAKARRLLHGRAR